MNSVVIRFYIIEKREYIDVKFDKRLSFKENFCMLEELYPINIDKYRIYDENNKGFYPLDKPIKCFDLAYYTSLLLF